MPTGFQTFKENGELLFDANLIQYGLIKSGYLTFTGWWKWYYLRSAQLDPNSESSWAPESESATPYWTITVENAQAPICFVAGDNGYVGTTVSGTTTTFYFVSIRNNPKVYIFDLMKDLGDGYGMQIFDDTGNLTFTTDMPGLNIINTVTANPPTGGTSWGNWTFYTNVYGAGSSRQLVNWYRSSSVETNYRHWSHLYSPPQDMAGATEVAVRLTYSRAMGYMADDMGNCSAFDCCSGGSSARFFAVQSPVTTRGIDSFTTWGYLDVPKDRMPTMQMIDTSHYPFPFR